MSFRIQGIKNAVKKAAAQTTGTRTIGQLIHFNNSGEATLTADDLHFPAVAPFDGAVDDRAQVQVDGIALVYVETAASIVAGSPLKPGATGVGAALATAAGMHFGFALVTPTADGQLIPVLLQKGYFAVS